VKANDFVALVLQSPLHALVGDTMLITVFGRKTGKPITTPVNYYRSGGTLWVLSSRSRKWWRNIGAGSRVTLHLKGRDVSGTADLVLEEAAVAAQLAEYVRELPASAGPLGLHFANGIPDPADVARLARERLFIKVCIQEPVR